MYIQITILMWTHMHAHDYLQFILGYNMHIQITILCGRICMHMIIYSLFWDKSCVYKQPYVYIYIYNIYIYNIYIYIQYISSLTKLVYWNVCKFEFKLKKSGRGGLGGRAQRLPPKADWKHLFSHARCWVECDTQVQLRCIYYTTCSLETCGM